MDMDEYLENPMAGIVGFLAFIVSYIYAIATFGFFIGASLGWIPAIFMAFIARFLWGLIVAILGISVVAGIIFFAIK